MRKNLVVPLILLMVSSFLFLSFGAEPVEVKLKGFLVEQSEGEEVLTPLETDEGTTKVAPGDTVEYLLVASNNTDEPVDGLSLKGPVPESTELNSKWYGKVVAFAEGEGEEKPPAFLVLKPDKAEEDSKEIPMKLPGRLPKFSVDGGEDYSFPPVKYEEDGETKVAEASQITNVLWEVPELPANGAVQVRYRVSVQ